VCPRSLLVKIERLHLHSPAIFSWRRSQLGVGILSSSCMGMQVHRPSGVAGASRTSPPLSELHSSRGNTLDLRRVCFHVCSRHRLPLGRLSSRQEVYPGSRYSRSHGTSTLEYQHSSISAIGFRLSGSMPAWPVLSLDSHLPSSSRSPVAFKD
jgi:hypothetical protein